jgi:hypothetical protein
MKIIFLDFDGVMITLGSWRNKPAGDFARAADPSCVDALNRIISETEARIVVSSSWRGKFIAPMREHLANWGVKGKVVGVTPRLEREVGSLVVAKTRGDEIQAWLDSARDVESFVILDDEADMAHLAHRLIQTTFELGLTLEHANRAIKMLTEQT